MLENEQCLIHLAPASVREREPEAPRFSGSTVPSRSFRFLQMMTQDDQQNDSKPVPGYNKPQQLMNKYDQQNLSSNPNRINMHPSRSFKFLQQMTSDEQQQQPAVTTNTRTGYSFAHFSILFFPVIERQFSSSNNGQPLRMNVQIQQASPMVQVNTTSSSSDQTIIDQLAATDF